MTLDELTKTRYINYPANNTETTVLLHTRRVCLMPVKCYKFNVTVVEVVTKLNTFKNI